MNEDIEDILIKADKYKIKAEKQLEEGSKMRAQEGWVRSKYLQGILRMQLALYDQNQVIIELLRK